jgi:hypothetical protein
LEADITITQTVGYNEDAPFRGTFDGNGHTLNVSIGGGDISGIAPFRYVGDATIHDLHVTGKINGGIHSAGLVGMMTRGTPTLTLNRVWISVDVTSTSTHTAGIVGHARGGNMRINDTRFDGKITSNNTAGSIIGCIIGWGGEGDWTFHRVYNCPQSTPLASYICYCVDSSSGTGKHWGGNSKSSLTITSTGWSDWKTPYYNKTNQHEVVNLMNAEPSG